MKRVILGLLAGLIAWGVLTLLVVMLLDFLRFHFQWMVDGAPVFLAGGLAGYIGRKHGPVSGAVIGLVHALCVVVVLLAMGLANAPIGEVINLMRSTGVDRSVLIVGVVSILVGAAGGYLGQRLARFRRGRSSLSN